MSEETTGTIDVWINGDDLKHLTVSGTTCVRKEVGPIDVRIKCNGRVYSKFVLETPEGDNEEISI